jgi:hypothetical protein
VREEEDTYVLSVLVPGSSLDNQDHKTVHEYLIDCWRDK